MPAKNESLSGYPPLLNHILSGGKFRPLLDSLDIQRHRSEWSQFIRELITRGPMDRKLADRFHTQWHVCHHYIRSLVSDDELVMDMLWTWLPRYQGPDLVLYRGENIDRLELGSIGTAWSTQEDKARMFASGLNAVGRGGVILETIAPAEAIIAGPSDHSIYLGEHEYTVDWRRLISYSRKCYFPPSH